jgi:hypothetical protein
MKHFSPQLIDAITLSTGFLAVVAKFGWRYFTRQKPFITARTAVIDFLNGSVIFPFVLLLTAVFSTEIKELLLQASPVTLSLAGGIGLMFVLGELIEPRGY